MKGESLDRSRETPLAYRFQLSSFVSRPLGGVQGRGPQPPSLALIHPKDVLSARHALHIQRECAIIKRNKEAKQGGETTMASAGFQGGKHKGGTAAKAQFRHNAKDTRKDDKHTNEELNVALTPLNTSVAGLSYDELCQKYDSRIQTLDTTTNENKRKDRVTMVSVVIPVPRELAEVDQDAWFSRVYEVGASMWGDQNMLDLTIHRDEVHEYRDSVAGGGIRESLVHGHLMFVPEVDGGLNARTATSKASIIAFNNALNAMSEKEFGVKFNDGSKRKGKASVEQLKAFSKELDAADARAERERSAADELRKQVMTLQAAIAAQDSVRAAEQADQEKRTQEAIEAARRAEEARWRGEVAKAKESAQKAFTAATEARQDVKRIEEQSLKNLQIQGAVIRAAEEESKELKAFLKLDPEKPLAEQRDKLKALTVSVKRGRDVSDMPTYDWEQPGHGGRERSSGGREF